MSTIYLVNNKKIEPTFPEQFAAGCHSLGHQIKELAVADLSYFVDGITHNITFYERGVPLELSDTDKFYIRGRKPFTSATALLSFALHAKGISFNEASESLGHNLRGSKLAQMLTFAAAGYNVPSSFISTIQHTQKHLGTVEQLLTYPMVAKQSGSKGEKVWKCNSREEVEHLLSELATDNDEKNILFQEYIENSFDIRIIVNYGEIIAAIARYSTDGFYNNVSQGGHAEKIKLTEEEQLIAQGVTRVVDLELAGIDIVRTDRGPVLFEVNKSPDISAFNEASELNLPAILAERFIKAETK